MKRIALRDGMTMTIWFDAVGANVRFAGSDDEERPFRIDIDAEGWKRIVKEVEEANHE